MEVAKAINLPEWMASEETRKVIDVISAGDKPVGALFVGGCVRNVLLGEAPTDIDIATPYKPEIVMEKLKDAAIKSVPTGIDHGTVTAVVNGIPFEITTLRKDVSTDGRHADVAFTDSWEEDALRRDFTINTLLADLEGNIYDPTGQGINDLKERKVVFVGDPEARIAEDYLRILRFFRFQAVYGEGSIDSNALKACSEAADHIDQVSRERITNEFLKILSSDKSYQVLDVMFNNGILSDLPSKSYDLSVYRQLCLLQIQHNAIDAMTRLFILGGNRARFFEDYLRLSHTQKKFLIKLETISNPDLYQDEKALKKAIFYHGNELLMQGYLLAMAKGEAQENQEWVEIVANWQAPECPITGETLMSEGYQTGPELGQELERRREEWLEGNI